MRWPGAPSVSSADVCFSIFNQPLLQNSASDSGTRIFTDPNSVQTRVNRPDIFRSTGNWCRGAPGRSSGEGTQRYLHSSAGTRWLIPFAGFAPFVSRFIDDRLTACEPISRFAGHLRAEGCQPAIVSLCGVQSRSRRSASARFPSRPSWGVSPEPH